MDTIVSGDLQQIEVNENKFQNKNVIISGGAGFIGSWLCDSLMYLGSKIICIDDLSTGLNHNISHLKGNPNFQFIQKNANYLDNSFENPDLILHLASRASPEDYQRNPIDTLNANSLGSYKLLELARKHDSTIVFASTSEVYGDAKLIPTPEEYWGNVNPIGVRSCYDEGKRFGEALFMAYRRQYGLDTRIVRVFNTYGPRLRADGFYGRALSRFIMQALKGQDITVYGDGTQTRSFCYITDTIRAILLALRNKKMKGEVVNIGNPNETTIIDLARKILQITNSGSSITFHPRPEDDPQRRCPDIRKAKKILGWEPMVSLEEGLQKTIIWFKKNFYSHT